MTTAATTKTWKTTTKLTALQTVQDIKNKALQSQFFSLKPDECLATTGLHQPLGGCTSFGICLLCLLAICPCTKKFLR